MQLVVLCSKRKVVIQRNSSQDINQLPMLGAKLIINVWVFNTKHLFNQDLSGAFFEAGTLPSPGATVVKEAPTQP